MQTENKLHFRFRWLGCACFEFDFGGLTIVNDPWITPNERTELDWECIEKCDYITLTHGHYDHTLDIPALTKKFGASVMCGENTMIPLMKWADLNPMSVFPMHPGLELDLDAVKVKAIYGRHFHIAGTVNERMETAKTSPKNSGHPLLPELSFWGDFEYRNYLFTLPNGTKILIWGNPLDNVAQRNMLLNEKPDILILQASRKNILNDVIDICKQLRCKALIPHHFDFPRDSRPVVETLGEMMAEQVPETRYILPNYGEWISM